VKTCKDDLDLQDEVLETYIEERERTKQGQVQKRKETLQKKQQQEEEQQDGEKEQACTKVIDMTKENRKDRVQTIPATPTTTEEKPAKQPIKYKAKAQEVWELLQDAVEGFTTCPEEDAECKAFYEGQIDALCAVFDLDKLKVMAGDMQVVA
jgi:hypothetical protein